MNRNEPTGGEAYESKNGRTGGNIPSSDIRDNTYAAEKGRSGGPQVIRDEDTEADPIDPRTSDSDTQLSQFPTFKLSSGILAAFTALVST